VTLRIDLNADVGELDDPTVDAALIPLLTSANVACGVHAGSVDTMRRAVRLAAQFGVAVGAHPGLPDRAGFGRRAQAVTASAAAALVLDQVRVLRAVAHAEGVRLRHLKPHGALYHLAARDAAVAAAIAGAVLELDPALALVGPPGSALLQGARTAGLRALAEGFADRSYRADGSLVPRGEAGDVQTDPAEAAAQAVRMVCDGEVVAQDGTVVAVRIDTLCLHSDTPAAADLARVVRQALEAAGVEVSA